QRAAVFTQRETDANLDDAHAEFASAVGFGFPGAAEIGEKTSTGHGGFGNRFFAAMAVDADGGSADEDLRLVADLLHSAQDVVCGENAGIVNAALHFGSPALRNVFACQVDDAIHAINAFERRLFGDGIPDVSGHRSAAVKAGLAAPD